jgi:hypothetical protein
MSFLAPLYIAGALFVALPVIFHLIRRSPRDRILFSSLMFLRESPPRVTRRSRLENLLLLVLRGTALTLMACAFARPFLREPLLAQVDNGDSRVVAILVDTSASMRRDDLWRQAIAQAARAIDQLRPVDQTAVFAFDRHVRQIIGFDEWLDTPPAARSKWINEQLEAIGPSWGSTNLGAALAAAADAVDGHATRIASSGAVPEQRVVLISDMQRGSDLSRLRQYEWPEYVRVEIASVSSRRHTNAAIQLIQDQGAEESTEPTALRVRVASTADSERAQFRVRWADDQSPAVDAYVAPGKSRVVQLAATSARGAAEQMIVEGDEHDFDNRIYLVPRRRETVGALFVGGGEASDPKGLLYYFERAFPETEWRTVRVLAQKAGDRVTWENLAAVRFAVMEGFVPDETVDALRVFVQSGGSLLCVLTSVDAAQSAGRVMRVDQWPVEEAEVRDYAMLGEIDLQHPLFAPFADPRYGDFTKIHFWHHRRVDLAALEGARVLARFDDRDPALIEVPMGHGRVFVLSAGWNPADSQLAVSSKFVPLIGGMLEYAMGAREPSASKRVGDALPLEELGAGALRIRLPDGSEAQLPANSREFSDTEQPGIYTVFGDAAPAVFAVNIDPAESQTEVLPSEELEQLGVRLTGSKSSARMEAEASRQRQMHSIELESRQKLWRWLIVVVLGILLVETWLAGRTAGSRKVSS